MLTRKDVLIIYKSMRGDVYPLNDYQSQAIRSLIVYKNRGEFDGSFDSAVKCLLSACYEVEGYKLNKELV